MFFSIVIPVYNKRETMRPMLQSVLRQDFGDFEVVLVDDGSTDGSIESVRHLLDARCRVIQQPNGGVSQARNRGIQEALGEYIAFLDADDHWHCDHLTVAHAFFTAHPTIGWYCANWLKAKSLAEVSASHRALPTASPPFETCNYFETGHPIHGHPVWTSATVFRRELVAEAEIFLPGLSLGQDLFAWFKVATITPVFGWGNKVTAIYLLDSAARTPSPHDGTAYVTAILDHLAADAPKGNPCLMAHINIWLRQRLTAGKFEEIASFRHRYHGLLPSRMRIWWSPLLLATKVLGAHKVLKLIDGLR